MPTTTFYVAASISPDGNFASCQYFRDQARKEPIDSSSLHVSPTTGECQFAPANESDLMLIGATFKTIGATPGMNLSNFAPADDENVVSITMPTSTTVTKGVVLLFSTRGTVEGLYPSSDPQITNDAPGL
ncbi:hypothetical protein [Roseateles chitosanitabidus]|uniref:hypothetical protein n=1 Tax=Roseateles chitosanitabidus TaxID=65048 RepID=UPI0011DF1074|nr:hypothetical protein [Roseateles chitosanitabidus]MBO9688376.1 hypothetical protein [Roseateles chitosanitabidus]